MSKLAIIGGSGLTSIAGLNITHTETITTPFGATSGPLVHGELGGNSSIIFLPRHGPQHTIPPHQINYRANLWALQSCGVDKVIGVAAVGGIRHDMPPLAIVIPDQLIDYTYGREHTFFAQAAAQVIHIDFTHPYCETLRQMLISAAQGIGIPVIHGGVYGATQGPRLETSAEIARMERDGCAIVGMTGMPEAALAKELGLCYACLGLVVNWAAGKGTSTVEIAEIETNLRLGMEHVRLILANIS